MKTNGDVKLTIAGLNTKIYQQKIKEVINASEFPKVDFDRYYRPNTAILPEACNKLMKIKDKMGFDDSGEWCGCILDPVGFFSINLSSKFHVNNVIRASMLQDLQPDYYLGMYNKVLYLSKDGFNYNMDVSNLRIEQFEPLEENHTIAGGVV